MDNMLLRADIVISVSCLTCVAIGAAMTFIPIIYSRRKKKRCSVRVLATCVELEDVSGNTYTDPQQLAGKGGVAMKAIYTANINGKDVKIAGNSYSIPYTPLKETKDLYVNPDDPTDYIVAGASHFWRYALISMGVIMMLAGLYNFIMVSIAFNAIENAEVVEVIED